MFKDCTKLPLRTLRQIRTVKQLQDHFVCPLEIAESILVYVHQIYLLLCGCCDGK